MSRRSSSSGSSSNSGWTDAPSRALGGTTRYKERRLRGTDSLAISSLIYFTCRDPRKVKGIKKYETTWSGDDAETRSNGSSWSGYNSWGSGFGFGGDSNRNTEICLIESRRYYGWDDDLERKRPKPKKKPAGRPARKARAGGKRSGADTSSESDSENDSGSDGSLEEYGQQDAGPRGFHPGMIPGMPRPGGGFHQPMYGGPPPPPMPPQATFTPRPNGGFGPPPPPPMAHAGGGPPPPPPVGGGQFVPGRGGVEVWTN